jgi:hypothetical protein
MKKFLSLVMIALFLVAQTGQVSALNVTKDFVLSATVPAASGITISASSIDAATGKIWTPVTGLALSFGTLTYNAANGIFLPANYFAIDVGTSGGSGTPSVVFTYTEGTNPNSGTTLKSLGWKTTSTFFKVTGTGASQVETALTAHGPKKMLKDLASETITSAEISGGYLRAYIGIVTKDSTAPYPDPVASELFTNADKPGTFGGTLRVSATVA